MQCSVIYTLVITITSTTSFSSYRPPAHQYPAEELSSSSSYGAGCDCCYPQHYSSPDHDQDYIVLTALVLGAVGWLAVAAAAFAALFLALQPPVRRKRGFGSSRGLQINTGQWLAKSILKH